MANFLIVDDDPIVRKMLEAALAKHGHSYVSTGDAFEALEKIKTELFEIVVCDIKMPVHNGFDFIATIRGQEEFKKIPVLFISGRREKKDVERALKVGGDDYLIKPIDFDLFFAKVEALLAKGPTPHEFSDTIVDGEANWSITFKMAGISEQGISFRSAIALPINLKFQLQCELFTQIGLETPRLRVATCKFENVGEKYLIKASFIGLEPAELQRIRKWSMSHQPRSAKKAS